MENYVFVLDTNKKPLNPVHPARARELLSSRKASVFRTYPFVIILHHAVDAIGKPEWELKIDPGSKITGIALVKNHEVFWGLQPKSLAAKKLLTFLGEQDAHCWRYASKMLTLRIYTQRDAPVVHTCNEELL